MVLLSKIIIAEFTRVLPWIAGLHILEHFLNKEHKFDMKSILINLLGAVVLILVGTSLMYGVEKKLPYYMVKQTSISNVYLYALTFFFINDVIYYFYHRLQHNWSLLWRIHQFHHTDPDMSVLTSYRTNFLDRPIQVTFISFPIYYMLGYHPDVGHTLLYMFFLGLLYTHLRVNLSHGIFQKVLTGPSLHRVHHSIDPKEYNSNYAQYFPIIDIIFGTFKAPRTKFCTTGVKDAKSTKAQIKSMFWPLARKVKDE